MFPTVTAEFVAWSKLLRENFTVVLLTIMYAAIFGTVIHMAHDGRDDATIGWVREASGAVAGCLFGMLTGKGRGATSSGEPSASSTITTITEAKGGPVPAVPPVSITLPAEVPKPAEERHG